MTNKYTHKELVEDFILFEKENSFDNLIVNNIPIWEFLRFDIFQKLRMQLVTDDTITITDRESKKIWIGFKNYLYNSLLKNPLRNAKKTNLLILNHPRRKYKDGVFVDIYTDYLFHQINEKEQITLERFHNLNHLKPVKTKNLYYLDYIEFPARIHSSIHKRIGKEFIQLTSTLNKLIAQRWGVYNILNSNFISKKVRYINFCKPKIEKLIKKINPNTIVMTVSYSMINLIFTMVAKRNKIPVIELQHGTVGKYHIGYNYHRLFKTNNFPDYFFTWGSSWIESTRLPLDKENIRVTGFPYLDNSRKEFSNVKKKGNQILVISQLREDIAHFALELASRLPNSDIIFKTHPNEYGVGYTKYPYLLNVPNLNINDNDNKSLYELIQESDFAIGVYSTALIEAIAFDTKVGIIKLPGWEYFEDIIETSGFRFLSGLDEAVTFISSASEENKNVETNKFFQPNALSNLINEMNKFKIDSD